MLGMMLMTVWGAGLALAVGVKPLRTELAIAPGESVRTTITVINTEDQEVRVRPSVGMYAGNDQQGYPIESDVPEDDPRHLNTWVAFDQVELTLRPDESRAVSLTITAPADAEPGGHYGSLLYEPIPEEGGAPVKVATRVASLLLITVTGEVRTDGAVTRFSVADHQAADRPFAFAIDFENSGTIHVRPEGSITILDAAGQQVRSVARYLDPKTSKEVTADVIPVNLLGGNVLPDSARTFLADWSENIQNGEYTAVLNLAYAGQQLAPQTTTFTVRDAVAVDDFALRQGGGKADFALKLQNTGANVVRPIGVIEVVNEFDFKVAEVTLGDHMSDIPAGESREVIVPWLSKEVPAGSYTARLNATYGYSRRPLVAEARFSAEDGGVPVGMLSALGALLAIGLGGFVIARQKGLLRK